MYHLRRTGMPQQVYLTVSRTGGATPPRKGKVMAGDALAAGVVALAVAWIVGGLLALAGSKARRR